MKRIVRLFLLILIATSTYVHAQIVDEARYSQPIKVACVGNSITYGSGIADRAKDSYPAQLGFMLGDKWIVRNFGVSGATLLSKGDRPYINQTNYNTVISWQPDVVIIKLGTNDSKPQNWKHKEEFETDYLNLIHTFKALPSHPVIVLCQTAPSFSDKYGITNEVLKNEINPLVRKIAREETLPCIDLTTPLLELKDHFPDGIHPDATGAGRMAQVIYKALTGREGQLANRPFGGKKSQWHGFDRYDFEYNGRSCRIVCPAKPAAGSPWIWNARFPDWHYEIDSILLSEGFYVTYINTDELLGSPKAVKVWDDYYTYLTGAYKFSEKVALEGISRGGLYVYNFAKKYPWRISCIYGEAPVCDFKSWPAGFGTGKGSPSDWTLLKTAYGFKDDAEAKAYRNNPVDSLDNLAKAKVPVLHMIGLNDAYAPPAENTYVLVDRYVKLGGIATVVPCTRGKQELEGHHFPIETPRYVANFVEANTPVLKPKLNPADYHIYRTNLKNSYLKFEKEKKGRVAFLGGSITFNPGWRDSVCSYLTKRFPETKFEFIAAGVPSLGSLPGTFRIQQDVLSKGPVDLLFEEAAVNDRANGHKDNEQIRSMEGIVRQARKSNPNMDIVIMYFVDPDKINDYNSGKVPNEILNHDKVASYYNIPVINLAREVTDRINAGEFTWEQDFKNLHPSPYGQVVYFNSMKVFLDHEYTGIKLTDQVVPNKPAEPIDPNSYFKAKMLSANDLKMNDGWKTVQNWTPADKEGTRPNYVHVPMAVCEVPGKILRIPFKGNAIGVAVVSGHDAGILEYSIDGAAWEKKDLFTQWSKTLHLPWFLMLADELKSGRHTLQLRLSAEKNPKSDGTACEIRYVLVNE
ncbi:MAG: SGNH/GDSL hydrolase family protein [Bacteroidota bacterium]|nr:SGNH/GDSL hydrolase family protein [Bacteroidota bacterium]